MAASSARSCAERATASLPAAAVAACHGIAIEPASVGLDLGWLSQAPASSVRVDVVDRVDRLAEAELVWQLVEPPEFGLSAITTETWRELGGTLWVGNTLNLSLRVDAANGVITIAPRGRDRQVLLEGLASVALPLLAQSRGVLVLHGAIASREGRGVLLTAAGGSGKSSLLMALVADGWSAVSEDQCAVDWDDEGNHRVWPGPSWVRLKQGVAPTRLVVGSAPRFEALDKVGWDLGPWMSHEPARLEKIVVLEPPGGDELVWERLATPAVITALAKQVTWLQDRATFAASSLPQVIRLASEVPGFRMRVPKRSDWLDHAVPLVEGP